MDKTRQANGAPRQMENLQKTNNGEAARKTACGNVWCECGRIMANLDLTKTPYFTVTNLDKRCGPKLPDWFVQEHGHEATGNVIVDSARTAGQILAVQFVTDEDEATGEVRSIRMGDGWESFMALNQLHAEDLLFFTLQGRARFIVMMIRDHSRPQQHKAGPQERQDPGKRKLVAEAADDNDDDDDDVDVVEGTAELWRAAKKRLLGHGTHQGVASDGSQRESITPALVTHITSDDALGSYMLLSDVDGDDGSDDGGDDCSDFEDEKEFLGSQALFRAQ